MSAVNEAMLFLAISMLLLGMVMIIFPIRAYYRSKNVMTKAYLQRAINALSKVQHRHESYHDGMGPCQCEAHVEARLVIRGYHERGEL